MNYAFRFSGPVTALRAGTRTKSKSSHGIHAGHGQDVLVFDKLQEVYERILKVQAPWALVWMLLLFLYSMVAGQARRSKTILINASIVGGLHDDKMRASTRLVI